MKAFSSDLAIASIRAYHVARRHNILTCEVMGRSRVAHVMRARRALYAELRAMGWSYPRIDKALCRDHSTVIDVLHGKGAERRNA